MQCKKFLPLQCLLFIASPYLFSATAEWNLPGNGVWELNGNWNPATFPNAIDDVAILGTSTIASSAITLSMPITLGTLTAQANFGYSLISIGGVLIMDVSAGSAE